MGEVTVVDTEVTVTVVDTVDTVDAMAMLDTPNTVINRCTRDNYLSIYLSILQRSMIPKKVHIQGELKSTSYSYIPKKVTLMKRERERVGWKEKERWMIG